MSLVALESGRDVIGIVEDKETIFHKLKAKYNIHKVATCLKLCIFSLLLVHCTIIS